MSFDINNCVRNSDENNMQQEETSSGDISGAESLQDKEKKSESESDITETQMEETKSDSDSIKVEIASVPEETIESLSEQKSEKEETSKTIINNTPKEEISSGGISGAESLQDKISESASDLIKIQPEETQEIITSLKSDVEALKKDVEKLKNAQAQEKITFLKFAIKILKAEKAQTKEKITSLESNVKTLETEKAQAQEKITSLESDIKTLETEKAQAQEKITSLESDIKTLETEKEQAKDTITSLKSDVKTLETEKAQAQEKITSLESYVKTLETEKAQAKDTITSLESDVKTLETEKAKLETEKAQAQEKITYLESDVKTLETEQGKFNISVNPYINLLKAIYHCPSMKEYLSEKGLPDSVSKIDIPSIITFIAVAGAKNIFAVDMLNYINKYKSQNPQPITQEEKNLMDTVNRFYQIKDNLPEDKNILFIPDGMENTNDFKVIFKKTEMRDIRTAIGNFKIAVALYSPGLRDAYNNTVIIKATVEGK